MSALLRGDLLTWLGSLLLAGAVALAWRGLRRQREPLGWPVRGCVGIAGYLFLLSLTARGLQTHGWPFTSTYEAVLLTAAATTLFYALGIPRRLALTGGVCTGLAVTPMVILTLLTIPPVARVPLPAMSTLSGPWFPIHVLSTGLGYGGLLFAGCAGLLRLALGWIEGKVQSAAVDAPEQDTSTNVDLLAWRGLAWGYFWLTVGIVSGAIWGWSTWGRYWSWTIKEVLTLSTWGLFALAFHTRRLSGWRGRPHATILAVGLLALLLTLLAADALIRQAAPTTLYIF